jgi:hypothetical protein
MKLRRVGTFMALLLCVSVAGTSAEAINVKLRPQTPEIEQLVQEILNRLSSKSIPLVLDKSAGTVYIIPPAGSVVFNPDVTSRTILVKGEKRVEFNPRGPISLKDAVGTELQKELGLSALTQEAAQLRYSGADLNADGKIDTADLAILMGAFGQNVSNARGDLNGDGHVDNLDLKLFGAEYKLP